MVAPLQVNCTAIRDGVLGPCDRSNLALKEPKNGNINQKKRKITVTICLNLHCINDYSRAMTKQEYSKNTVESNKPITPGNVSQKNVLQSHKDARKSYTIHFSLSKSKLSAVACLKHGHTLCFSCTRDFLEFPQSSLMFSRPKN